MATKAKAGISRRESLKAGGKAAYVAANRHRHRREDADQA